MDKSSIEQYQSVISKLVAERHLSSGLDPELLADLIKSTGAVVQKPITQLENLQDGTYKAMSSVFRIVIRDDLLNPLDFFLNLLRHCIGLSIGVASMLNPASAPAGAKTTADAVWSLYELFKKIVASGHLLTQEEFAVVSELLRLREATPEAVAEQLCNLDAQRVLMILRKFEYIGSTDTRFTRINTDGKWELVGV